MIKRADLIKEEILREFIRKRIHEVKQNDPEHKLRMIIRQMIKEDVDRDPTENTGINVLSDLLNNIVKSFKNGYKQLTTSPEQRISYIKHMLAFIKGDLEQDKQLDDAGEEGEEAKIETDVELAEVSIDVGSDEEEVAQEDDPFMFPDIDKPTIEKEQETEVSETDDLIKLEDEDEMGRTKAVQVWDQIEKQTSDAYAPLRGLDARLFSKYIIKNLDLHRKEAEKELPNPDERLMTVNAEDL